MNPRTQASFTGKREQNKAQNRTAILAAALDVFSELGYGAATVRDIIRRTDLAAGTFYNYFPDKESVFIALIDDYMIHLGRKLREARREATDLTSFIENSYRTLFAFMSKNQGTFALLRRNSGAVRAIIEDSVVGTSIQNTIEDIEEAMQKGILPPVDSGYLATVMESVPFEVALHMLKRDPIDVEEATRFAMTFVTGGVIQLGKELKD